MRTGLFAAIVFAVHAPAAAAQDVCSTAPPWKGAAMRPALPTTAFDVSSTRTVEAEANTRLQAVMDGFEAAMHPAAVTASILLPDGSGWNSSAPQAPLFYWASAGKAWTGIAILQLVEEGKLSLSDTLDRWAPDFPNAKLITVDQLLTHTSGLYSFQEDEGLRAKPGYKSREQVLAAARAHAPLFCPGEAWYYSNTGYALLGVIVEKLDGRPLRDALTARIVDRLGLTETRILGEGVSVDGIALPRPAGNPGGTADDIRTPGAAGPIAASSSDMAKFWMAALSGKLVSSATSRGQFARLYAGFDKSTWYGRAVMAYDLPASDKTPADTWLGHSGGMPGVRAVVAWSTRQQAVIAVALSGDAPAEALANRLAAALEH